MFLTIAQICCVLIFYDYRWWQICSGSEVLQRFLTQSQGLKKKSIYTYMYIWNTVLSLPVAVQLYMQNVKKLLLLMVWNIDKEYKVSVSRAICSRQMCPIAVLKRIPRGQVGFLIPKWALALQTRYYENFYRWLFNV